MNKLDFYLENVIGKRTNKNIFDRNGTLLIPAATVITYDHVILLEENKLTLAAEDVIDIGVDFKKHAQIIDETVKQVRGIFGTIRETRKIPLANIRENIVPMIHVASDSKYVLQLFAALQAKDDYTYRHNIAVGAITNLLGKWLKLADQELLQLTTAALLHDVGKMMIPERILNKPGKLTDEEFALMKKHTVYGYEILKETVGISHRQALVALHHHERMDGSGYPLGIKGEEIDKFSRIVAVVDVFHAMSSNRVYREQFPFYKVLAEMEKDMFSVLDPEITMLFIERTMNSLIGNTVLLTDGRKATIVNVPKNNPTSPLVQVGDLFIDLYQDQSVKIEQIIG